MKFVILLLALSLVATAGTVYPPYAEGTRTACAAFERRATGLADAQFDQAARAAGRTPATPQSRTPPQAPPQDSASAGLIADAYSRLTYPDIPPVVICTIAYWKTIQDPQFINGMSLPKP